MRWLRGLLHGERCYAFRRQSSPWSSSPDRLQYGLLHQGNPVLQTAFLSWRAAYGAALVTKRWQYLHPKAWVWRARDQHLLFRLS